MDDEQVAVDGDDGGVEDGRHTARVDGEVDEEAGDVVVVVEVHHGGDAVCEAQCQGQTCWGGGKGGGVEKGWRGRWWLGKGRDERKTEIMKSELRSAGMLPFCHA